MKSRLLLLVLMTVGLSAMAGQVYSWTDANGVKHFSDSPPPANVAKAQKIQVRGQLTTQTASEQPAADDAAKANPGPALAAAAGYSPDDIKRNCEIANTNLVTLGKQVIPTDDQGTPLDPEAAGKHQAMVDKANQQVKLFCTPQ
jgi:hypothetical protein